MILAEISVFRPAAGGIFFSVFKSFRYENSVFKLFRQCIYNALLRVGERQCFPHGVGF
jgi:hypothetical protein